MKKTEGKKNYICTNCDFISPTWFGKCPNCDTWDSFVLEDISKVFENTNSEFLEITNLSDISYDVENRVSSGLSEFDRVLGGKDKNKGFISSQVVLLSGEPGVGKSTLLMQTMASVQSSGIASLYVSSEESVAQVASRAKRIIASQKGILIDRIEDEIRIVSITKLEDLLAVVQKVKPGFLIIDSIQSLYSDRSASFPGSMAQIRICVHEIVRIVKKLGIITVIVGHITKEGDIAGPKLLEHLVDTVIQLEGDQIRDYRFMRVYKNRFGPTMEIGIFQMDENGLSDLSNPYLFDSKTGNSSPGVSKAISVQGVRPIIVEIESLVTKTFFPYAKRVSEGISIARLQRIAAIVTRYTKISLFDKDIYLKVSGGLKIDDPSVDLAIAFSIISSATKKALHSNIVFIGELALSGRIVDVVRFKDRQAEIKRLGFKAHTNKDIEFLGNYQDSSIFVGSSS
jgi:DNA repair protein RadA/Sms